MQLLPLGSIETRQPSNLSGPLATVHRPRVAIVLYIVQALLKVLERSKLRFQYSIALVQVVNYVIELSSLLYSDLFLVVQVRGSREQVSSGLSYGHLRLVINVGRHSEYLCSEL